MRYAAYLLLILLCAVMLGAQVQTPVYTNGIGMAPTIPTNCTNGINFDGTTFSCASASGGLPSGMIAFINSGSCPSGWAQVASAGDYVLLTVAANSDVGTSGGSTSYTPAGTNAAATFSGTPGTVPAETFTGNALATHTHTLTPTGTNGTSSVATTSGSFKGTSSGGFSQIGGVAPGSSFTVGAQTFTGALDTSSAVSAGTPSGTNSTASFTPAGTESAAAFSGTPATIQPTYLKLIGCSKN